MKLIKVCEKETKQVNYFGIELIVDADINFLAADYDSFVYGYFPKPIVDNISRVWIPKQGHTPYPVAKVEFGDKDWKEMLAGV